MPTFTVYILHSSTHDVYYKGYTSNMSKRLFEHNKGLSLYTKDKGPWRIVWMKEYESKSEALIEERRIKKLNRRSLEMMLSSYRDSSAR